MATEATDPRSPQRRNLDAQIAAEPPLPPPEGAADSAAPVEGHRVDQHRSPIDKSDARLAEEERLAEEVYDRLVRPAMRPEDDGKYVAIAFEAGDFEVDLDDYAATGRLLIRRPGAKIWLMRAGRQAAYRVRGLTVDES